MTSFSSSDSYNASNCKPTPLLDSILLEEYFDDFQKKQILVYQFAQPQKTKRELIKIVFNEKFFWFIDTINFLIGKELLTLSNNQFTKSGKVWYLCTIPLDKWMKMDKESFEIECCLDVYGRSFESNPIFLQKLVDMNPSTHYMLSMEFVLNEESILDTFEILNPLNSLFPPPAPWKMTLKILSSSEILKRGSKSYCPVCRKIDLENKYMVCGRCKERRYCSVECQKRDWNAHKLRCHLLAKLHYTKG